MINNDRYKPLDFVFFCRVIVRQTQIDQNNQSAGHVDFGMARLPSGTALDICMGP